MKLSDWLRGKQPPAKTKTRGKPVPPENHNSTETRSIHFEPRNAEEPSQFFEANRDKYQEIRVVLTKKTSANPQPVSFTEAVTESTKHGLIDSRTRSLSDQKYGIRFTEKKQK
jgi:hypothetical protein